jgi:HD superfamily phosphohydrolase
MSYSLQRIRDPLHNLIEFKADHFENVLWDVIKTRPFQRLRRVKQLGFSDFVYPGATHSRFLHSIGVFHTARLLMGVVEKKLGTNVDSSKRQHALAAALVHDLGHGPFSHAFEDVGEKLGLQMADHEAVSDALIRESEISDVFKRLGSGFSNDVADIIKGGPGDIYSAVVSSQFDADRLDYIRRDRLMSGNTTGQLILSG